MRGMPRRQLAAIEQYVTVMAEVVAEARDLAETGGWPLDAVPDEDVLHGLVRLRDAVAAARRPRPPLSRLSRQAG